MPGYLQIYKQLLGFVHTRTHRQTPFLNYIQRGTEAIKKGQDKIVLIVQHIVSKQNLFVSGVSFHMNLGVSYWVVSFFLSVLKFWKNFGRILELFVDCSFPKEILIT
jgi:hypothetical protein